MTKFLGTVLLSVFLLTVWQCSSSRERISYNEHIRPIFNKKCLACHGGVKKMGGFSLLFEEEAYAETESGKRAIVPGNHKKSELYRRLIEEDPRIRMPHEEAALSTEEIALIAQWIDEGAKWEDHWAYSPPQRPSLPAVQGKWGHNDIDPFILAGLENAALSPEPEADKHILLRRASLDLTGLPPEPELVQTFLADESPAAFERAVDQLLASPHFGERWAAMWLDLARYADSKGYEKDPHRDIWRFRDWVIAAFNEDMPFDRFTIEQLAGDLLPDPSADNLIATAFHRNTMTNTEGGTEDEEFRVAAVIDRINTTFEVWQGTTLSCVQCHSHPYDPIRHEEFYRVMDLFNHCLDQDLDTELPTLETFSEADAHEIEEIIGFVQELEPRLSVDRSAPLARQIREAVFPMLIPNQCDDFANVTFGGNGLVTNWVYNLQAIGDKQFRFKFADVDLEGLTHISFSYSTEGDDARMEVRADKVGGELISEVNFAKANAGRWQIDEFPRIKVPAKAMAGKHDLIFEIINTTGAIPDGMLTIGRIELHYENKWQPSLELEQYRKQLAEARKKADHTPITLAKSSTFQRSTHVFERGNWTSPGEKVSAGVPQSMLAEGLDQPADRLAFARWLASPENPLTARVIVNRFWEQIFGNGIIESLEDFGTQGLQASHPELLDYLAVSFMEDHQWRVKGLLKEILLSAAYRQSSKADPAKLEVDPYNRLISRGSRFRLSAEQVRDQALAVSDLLFDSIGGKSVMPLQPEGVWQVVYSNQRWETPTGKDRYRRGLYTYWKRTAPYPSMVAFDSPSREFCVSRRIRTNTPLQALVTLNDPVFLEAARALGNEMVEAGREDLRAGIRRGYLLAMSREADEQTVDVLQNLYQRAASELEQPAPKATPVSNTVDEGTFSLEEPMTVVANAIMNLDGFMMKE